jgi:hypothetical protein
MTLTDTLAPSILPLLGEAPAEAFCWNVPQFELMSSMVEKRVPLRPIFRAGNSEIWRVWWLGDDTISDVWLGALS